MAKAHLRYAPEEVQWSKTLEQILSYTPLPFVIKDRNLASKYNAPLTFHSHEEVRDSR